MAGVLTEAEAARKWCPLARVATQERISGDWQLVAVNRVEVDGDAVPIVNCIGARCMAWQWADDEAGRGYCGALDIVNAVDASTRRALAGR